MGAWILQTQQLAKLFNSHLPFRRDRHVLFQDMPRVTWLNAEEVANATQLACAGVLLDEAEDSVPELPRRKRGRLQYDKDGMNVSSGDWLLIGCRLPGAIAAESPPSTVSIDTKLH